MPAETALVTGGAGFIGSALCRALVGRGHEVVALDDLSVGRRELLPPGCRLHEVDVRDAEALDRAVRGLQPRRVFHLAALHYIPHCNADPVRTIEINVNGTRNLLVACRGLDLEALFLASTAAVYPAQGSPFAEEMPAAPIDIYGHSKLMAEDLARLFHLETSRPTAVGRLFNVFGPHDSNPHVIPDVVAQARGGAEALELGNLDPVRDYVHVDDVVSGIVAAAEAVRSAEPWGVFNIGSGQGQSVRQVVAAVETALGRPLRIVQVPSRLRRVERDALVADVTRLTRQTGWRPRVAFARGIASLVTGSPA
jgi:UDP-glucose 4-epimerase